MLLKVSFGGYGVRAQGEFWWVWGSWQLHSRNLISLYCAATKAAAAAPAPVQVQTHTSTPEVQHAPAAPALEPPVAARFVQCRQYQLLVLFPAVRWSME